MDENGWVSVNELIEKSNQHQQQLDIDLLKQIVAQNDKQRFSFNDDGSKIRANQGHSVNVDLLLQPAQPPTVLYHGTVGKFIAAIKAEGLQKMSRQHVHLSANKETANTVGSRRGKAIVLTIDAARMHKDGFIFYLSDNGVWLCDEVPVQYINF